IRRVSRSASDARAAISTFTRGRAVERSPHSSGGSLPQTEACMAQLRVGDLVIRSHRLLKTRGAIVRVAAQRRGEAPHVWVKWNHSDTLPNLRVPTHPDRS